MKEYDVVIIGAGPAGGQCARLLSQRGHSVLLVEKVNDFSKNDFSSAGSIIEIQKQFDLPDSVIGSHWNMLHIWTQNSSYVWKSDRVQGVVMNFQKLRSFLAHEATKTKNCDLLMAHSFESVVQKDNRHIVTLRNLTTNEHVQVLTKIIIDATGPARAVLYANRQKPQYKTATGIEYLIEVNTKNNEKLNNNDLQFFLGTRWVPKGYAWIFAMEDKRFKIGVGRYNYKTDQDKPLKSYVEYILHDHLNLKDDEYTVIDVHGGTLQFIPGNKDVFVDGTIIGIGDTVSSVNPLGGEGIRHGMYSATVAANYVDKYLKGEITELSGYEKEMKKYFGLRWRLSYYFSKLIYEYFSDKRIEVTFKLMRSLTLEELVSILFKYDFKLLIKAIFRKFFK